MAFRTAKIASLVKKIVSAQLQRQLPDFLLTITEVNVSKDLKHASLWVSGLDIEKLDEEKLKTALAEHQPAIQGEVAHQMQSRFTPKIEFHIDNSARHAHKINEISDEKLAN